MLLCLCFYILTMILESMFLFFPRIICAQCVRTYFAIEHCVTFIPHFELWNLSLTRTKQHHSLPSFSYDYAPNQLLDSQVPILINCACLYKIHVSKQQNLLTTADKNRLYAKNWLFAKILVVCKKPRFHADSLL